MEERKPSRMNKLLAERNQWIQFNRMEKKEMLTDEQASSWKKAIGFRD